MFMQASAARNRNRPIWAAFVNRMKEGRLSRRRRHPGGVFTVHAGLRVHPDHERPTPQRNPVVSLQRPSGVTTALRVRSSEDGTHPKSKEVFDR